MTGIMRMLGLTLGVVAGLTVSVAFADEASDAAKKDMAATLGADAVELKILPDAYFAVSWALGRRQWVEQAGVIPPKYRALIGLAVSSQIPCQFCIYADTSDARVFGATDEEIKEAVMAGASSRFWSTLLNGNQADLAAFKKEIDAGAAAMREAMKKETTTQ